MTTNDEPTRRVEITSSWTPAPQPPKPVPQVVKPVVPVPPPPLSPAARQAAATPLVVLLIANGLAFATAQFPEVPLPSWFLGAMSQLRLLVSSTLVTLGNDGPGHDSAGSTQILVSLVGAFLLAGVVRTRFRGSFPILVAPAVLVTLPLGALLITGYSSAESGQSVAAGLILGLLAVAAAAATPVLAARGGVGLGAPAVARAWWALIAYAVVYLAPLAVGRAAVRAGVVTAGPSDLQSYLAGLALGVVVWSAAQLIPPIRAGRIGIGFILVALAMGPLLDIAAGRY